jgi:hypothetical protein
MFREPDITSFHSFRQSTTRAKRHRCDAVAPSMADRPFHTICCQPGNRHRRIILRSASCRSWFPTTMISRTKSTPTPAPLSPNSDRRAIGDGGATVPQSSLHDQEFSPAPHEQFDIPVVNRKHPDSSRLRHIRRYCKFRVEPPSKRGKRQQSGRRPTPHRPPASRATRMPTCASGACTTSIAADLSDRASWPGLPAASDCCATRVPRAGARGAV